MVRKEDAEGRRSRFLRLAEEAAGSAYAPYSRFYVGAVVVASNGEEEKVFTGANVENASYGLTVCAERVAVFKAVTEGYRRIKEVYIVAKDEKGNIVEKVAPCGACRQVIYEFSDDAVIHTPSGSYTIEELLPAGFRLEDGK